ncbi:protein-L-isoaspartate O-methyltransferase [Propionigenium maris DSM 9537]|uniref:Protein-L-isoaspartate O-methyltransferase n=1 Tax=Propionigenium maris DSM 9537 TaxID=1123000 RepID=A0A9W6GN31_9FUSO|nr:protein-L-isoaspartate(D-aspartate) O-methyltransferase [Propionigenium maris]GLI56592.1 protein-L-isoaspartate O-methyltransferase [Propionigenium maris DSM 9537]
MWEERRADMVREQIEARGITDRRVIEAMKRVPRHLFVRERDMEKAYWDYPIPIGWGQTISQPFIVAYMVEALRLTGGERVLEIGAGSGYEAAILSLLASEVVSMEIVPDLAREVEIRLRDLGYYNVEIIEGNGYRGYEERAPYDAIILSAAPESIPKSLIKQLAPGGRMILPLGGYFQRLVLLERGSGDNVYMRELLPVRFVPMVGY